MMGEQRLKKYIAGGLEMRLERKPYSHTDRGYDLWVCWLERAGRRGDGLNQLPFLTPTLHGLLSLLNNQRSNGCKMSITLFVRLTTNISYYIYSNFITYY